MMRVGGRGREVGGRDVGGAVRGAGRRTSWLQLVAGGVTIEAQ